MGRGVCVGGFRLCLWLCVHIYIVRVCVRECMCVSLRVSVRMCMCVLVYIEWTQEVIVSLTAQTSTAQTDILHTSRSLIRRSFRLCILLPILVCLHPLLHTLYEI